MSLEEQAMVVRIPQLGLSAPGAKRD